MEKLVECVPNISEGRDLKKINIIAKSVETIKGITLLDIDPGYDTNRTVITFVGTPENVAKAAFVLIKKAIELIDMSSHSGAHPRFGAVDVCPFIPISNISMKEVVELARKLSKKVGNELEIPIYCYENAAFDISRKNLSICRKGEYEALSKRLSLKKEKPDFGPNKFSSAVKKTGATAIGARDFLVAYNINLNTTSKRRANAIAFDVRELGRVKTENDKPSGKKVFNKKGEAIRVPGKLKSVKGIGWYIKEYGIAQISYNLTNISVTSIHEAFEESCKSALKRGLRVTGSELVGLVPLKAMLDAGDYFLKKQQRSLGCSEKEKIKIAVKSLGLDDLKPFLPEEKIIEYKLNKSDSNKLINISLEDFVDETASESMAPGGGSISAYVGSLGVALATMVANISSHKPGWDDRWEEFSTIAQKGQEIKNKLLYLTDEDTLSFNKLMTAFRLPKETDSDKKLRKEAIEKATKYATEIPFTVMKTAFVALELISEVIKKGLPSSLSDSGVAALAIRTAVIGAYFNVKTNIKDIKDNRFSTKLLIEAETIYKKTLEKEQEITSIVLDRLSNH